VGLGIPQRSYFGENLSAITAHQETSMLVRFRYALSYLNWGAADHQKRNCVGWDILL
jgi:hypothetical protein